MTNNNHKILTDNIEKSYNGLELVKPMIEEYLNGKIISVEEDNKNSQICKVLDMDCGIDALIKYNTGNTTGLAIRVQPTKKNWRTFTTRLERMTHKPTEYDKRKSSIVNDGSLYPYYTIQIYTNKNITEVISFAIIKTTTLFERLDKGIFDGNIQSLINNQDGSLFYPTPWNYFTNDEIYIYECKEEILQEMTQEEINQRLKELPKNS